MTRNILLVVGVTRTSVMEEMTYVVNALSKSVVIKKFVEIRSCVISE